MTDLFYVPKNEFKRILGTDLPGVPRTALFSALCRINTLYMIKRAGSGHLGTSFSCQDIISWLYLNELKRPEDLFFSSKGHDAPALYATLAGLGDLVTTCISPLGRNRSAGEKIGQGMSAEEVIAATPSVIEGIPTTRSVRQLAVRHGVEMPITEAVHAVLFEGKDVIATLSELMSRQLKEEN